MPKMNLNCSAKMIKYLMIFFNFFFVITGIILIGIGASVKTVYSQYHTFLDDQYYSLPNMLIATGIIIFIISFCGCCGAMKESWVLTGIFAILLIVIFIFELSIGIAGYVLRNKTYDYLHESLLKNQKFYNESEPIVMKLWDTVQDEFQCCGVNNYTDWSTVLPNYDLPISCCPRVDGSHGAFYCNAYSKQVRVVRQAQDVVVPAVPAAPEVPAAPSANPELNPPAGTANTSVDATNSTATNATEVKPAEAIPTDAKPTEAPKPVVVEATTPFPTTSHPYKDGCVPKFGDFIRGHAADLAGAGIALAVIQVLGIAFSFYLTKQLKNGYYST